jgi:adenylate cyclase
MGDPALQNAVASRSILINVLGRIRARLTRRGGAQEVLLAQARARHIHIRLVLGFVMVVAIVGHAQGLYRLPAIGLLDRMIYDVQVRSSLVGGIDDRVAIVDIDERSLATIGRWPWRRDVVATLVDQLFDRYSATVVGFDVAFAEPDTSENASLLEEIKQRNLPAAEYQDIVNAVGPILDRDARLAEALRGRPVVLSYYFSTNEGPAQSSGAIGVAALNAGALSAIGVNATHWSGYSGNLAVLQDAAAHAGHFNAFVDDDGRTRRIPVVIEYNGGLYESLALAVVRRLLGMPQMAASESAAGVTALSVGSLDLPVDREGATYIPFRGPRGSFRYVSAADVVDGRAPASALSGKIVLVGSSAPGLFDLRATPVTFAMPGVEMHANVVSGMLDRRIKAVPSYAAPTSAALTLLAGALLAFWLPRLTPGRAFFITTLVAAGAVLFSRFMWSFADMVFPIAPILSALVVLVVLNTFYGYFVEAYARREFADVFGPYVPPALVEQMARDPARYRDLITPRNETLTVVFADLRGFTTLAEAMHPEQVRLFLNDYFTDMSEVIHQYQGTVDKYIGDEVMAFWGAPVSDADHARHAVLAALEMHESITRLRGRAREHDATPLDLGVGINTGLMSVGDMGSTFRRSYTVLGDPVNLAKRLESLTRYYGVGIIIGDNTRSRVPDLVCREIDWVQVRGRGEVVTIFEPLGFAGEVPRDKLEELGQWGRALAAYRRRDWSAAQAILAALQRPHAPDRFYEFYAARIARLEAAPPPATWNGVTVFDQK